MNLTGILELKLYRLHRRQVLPITQEEAWSFFSDPHNLSSITPPWLRFTVTGEVPTEVYAGAIIRYTVRPFRGVKLSWVTEITHVDPMRLFVDEQRFGPYRFWHHQHLFRNLAPGVEVEDIVHYALPFGPAGRLVHQWKVRHQLEEIFAFRQRVLSELFDNKSIIPGLR